MARADIHIRVREGVIRVHVSETAVRTVIRITAQKNQLLLPPAYLRTALRPPEDLPEDIRMSNYAVARS